MFSDCYLDFTGGIVSSIKAQKSELEKLGHTVYVFTTGFSRKETEIEKLKKQHIYVVPSCRLFFRWVAPISRRPAVIEKWLMANFPELKDFDVFHIHYEAGCSIAGIRLGRKLGVPIVQTMHGREDAGEEKIIPWGLRTFVAVVLNLIHSWYLPHKVEVEKDEYLATTKARAKMWTMMVNHANCADIVVTPSQHFCKKLKHYGVKRRIEIVSNGVNDTAFPKNIKAHELKAGEPLRIIWHSRLSAEKRIMVFLEALSKVEGEYFLDVYGDGEEMVKAQAYAKLKKLKVDFHGVKTAEEVREKLNEVELDVLVSYGFDNQPMTLLEARAAGVPVLYADPDMAEIVPNGGGVMTSSGNVAAITEAINELISRPQMIRKMSEVMIKTRDKVRQSQVTEDLLEVYVMAKSDIIKS